MKNTFKICLFLIVLAYGILYVDYQNNSLLGNNEITVIREFKEEISRISLYFK